MVEIEASCWCVKHSSSSLKKAFLIFSLYVYQVIVAISSIQTIFRMQTKQFYIFTWQAFSPKFNEFVEGVDYISRFLRLNTFWVFPVSN